MSKTYPPLPLELLLARGSCCGSGCYNCPYISDKGGKHVLGSTKLNPSIKKKKK